MLDKTNPSLEISTPAEVDSKTTSHVEVLNSIDPPSPITSSGSEDEPSRKTNSNLNDTTAKSTPSPKVDDKSTVFNILDASIDDDRPFKVIAIGAGFSGVLAGIRFPQRMKNLDLTIYEKNSGVGGTWFSNRYPGIACDVPAHCYQFTFENKADWSSVYSPGPEIRANIESLVEKYKLMRFIKLRHEIVHARYNEDTGKWVLRIRRPAPGSMEDNETFEEFEDTADFVFSGMGVLSRWDWPNIDGLRTFKSRLIHSAAFETDETGWWHSSVKDWGDKKVAVIGGGSSTTQIVPALQPYVGHLYNYVRGKCWLAPSFMSDKMSELLKRDVASTNYIFTDKDREALGDHDFYKNFRKEIDQGMSSSHLLTIKGTEMQVDSQQLFEQHMKDRLKKKPWILNHLKPSFSVACRRLTPGPGYLEALQEDNVDFVPTHIKRITERGIELIDGTHHELDVIICATGYDTSFQYPFDIIGRGGINLRDKYTPHPETYLSICTDGFPNWFTTNGPNSAIGTGSLLLIMERHVDYAVSVARKLQRERLKSIEPKKEAVKDFDDYLEAFFKISVFSEGCSSWYKLGKADGRVVGLWPGSALHAAKAVAFPRWEDFNYEPLDKDVSNRFYWFGDGSTHNEKHMTGDRAWYLNPEEVDYPPVPKN